MIQETRILMGMPITIAIADPSASQITIEKIFDYFRTVDERFSPFKETSEVSMINRGVVMKRNASTDMKDILALAEKTKQETDGYFDIITPHNAFDPSGIVKGWAIWRAAEILRIDGFENFFVDAGGDIQPCGKNERNEKWRVGIQNPFKANEIIKTVLVDQEGVATSGTYARGEHIYDPKTRQPANEIVSLTVIGPDVLEADRFATGAFAMGEKGIEFIETRPGLEGYMIDKNGIATMTSGFEKYTMSFRET